MAKKQKIESDDERSDRLKKQARRHHDARAEDAAIDAMVKQSIKIHGA